MPRHAGDVLKGYEKLEAKKKLKALDKKSAKLSAADDNYVISALLWAANNMLTYGDLLKIRRLYELYK
ncbi:MAG: hypothetical protein MOB07_17470 [Acidobacteria bacterium]|nr:hypothetical protein [Acidobacteriota bacterium]